MDSTYASSTKGARHCQSNWIVLFVKLATFGASRLDCIILPHATCPLSEKNKVPTPIAVETCSPFSLLVLVFTHCTSMDKHEYHFDTLQLHAGQQVDSATNARAVPIYASTSFTFNSIDHALAIFANEVHGFAYSRYKKE